ncbi:hypothetical protein ABNN70_01830 [Sporolactobacillus sp. Y61]|uniref:Integral membrane protein n=1 Tax=Sporolactobacillus sp. Y61 TaxID=3160863 RepID=A0AAU8IGZ9_9BACL
MFISGFIVLALSILWESLVAFISLTGGLVCGGFILGYLERWSNTLMIHSLGMKGIYMTAWLGTPIHEISHAVLCLLFGHKVTAVRLLQPASPDGTIGYVHHAYNPDSLYQRMGNLFIGLAPLFGGGLAILLFIRVLVPDSFEQIFRLITMDHSVFLVAEKESWLRLGQAVLAVIRGLFSMEHLTNPGFWIFVILALCIASHMSLSREDIRGAAGGAGALLLLFVVANTLSVILDPLLHDRMMDGIGRFNFCYLILMSLAVLFSFIKCFISLCIYRISSGKQREGIL